MRGGAIRKNKGIKHGTRMNIRLRDFPGKGGKEGR